MNNSLALQKTSDNCRKMIHSLKHALTISTKESYAIEATLGRFRSSLDLFLKLLQEILLAKGADIAGLEPKGILAACSARHMIKDEEVWLATIDDRTIMLGAYDHNAAYAIYKNTKNYYPLMQSVFDKLATYCSNRINRVVVLTNTDDKPL